MQLNFIFKRTFLGVTDENRQLVALSLLGLIGRNFRWLFGKII
jgi:hypothetical protein